MTSPWDGRSRTPLRIGVSLVAAFDACLLGFNVMTTHPGPTSLAGRGTGLFLWMGGRPGAVVPLVMVVLVALWLFARRWHSLSAGAVALGGLFASSTALTVLQGHASRNFYTCGATLFGWLCGELAARALPADERAARNDALAEAGAAAAFAATYFAAGMSKLLHGGLAWADASSLQSLVLSQHAIADRSWLGAYAHAIAHSAALATGLAIATLIMELGALAFVVGARGRMTWGALFILFHVNVFVLTGIPYLENVVLAGLLSFPWPLVARWRAPTKHTARDDLALPARALATPALLLVVAAIGVRLVPAQLRPVGNPYTRRQSPAVARSRPLSSASVPTSPTLGPLRTGDALGDGWSVERIEPRAREARISLRRGGERVVLVLSLDKPSHSPGPFSAGGVDVSYRSTPIPPAEFTAPTRKLVSDLVARAGKQGLHAALEAWLQVAARAGSPRRMP